MKLFTQIILLSIFFSSCSMLGINVNRKAPKHAKSYPKFSKSDSLIGYLYPARACYRPYFYKLKVDFNLKQKSIVGSNQIFFEAQDDFDSLQLDLDARMKIEKIILLDTDTKASTQSETLLTYSRKYNAFWVNFPTQVKKGEHRVIQVFYSGKPVHAKRPPWDGGFVWKKDDEKRPWVGVACEKIGASIWWPLKDHLTAEPDSMEMTYITPDDIQCVANGVCIDKGKVGGQPNKQYFTYKVSYPINTYNVTFYLGNFDHFSMAYNKAENKRLHFYVLDYNLEKAKKHMAQTAEIIKGFEELYGEYPYWRDDYKLVESPYEGMEHQTAIAYGHGYNTGPFGYDYIILHESAHEWWGNAISVADYADIWIHEGMATYSEALLVEKKYGKAAYENYLYFYSYTILNKKPVVGPKDVNYWDYKDGDPYTKGALMMMCLRNTLANDSLFFAIIKGFYQDYKHKTVQTSDFIAYVNRLSGKDYSWFFKQFLNRHDPPVLSYFIEVDEKSDEQKLYYRWKGVDSDFVMPVRVIFPDGSKHIITPGNQDQVLRVWGEGLVKVDKLSGYFRPEERKRK